MPIAVEEALVAILTNDPATAKLVGSSIEPGHSKQGAAHPRITYQRISTTRIRHLLGRSMLAHPRIQINCFGLTLADAKNTAAAVVTALENVARNSSWAGWTIRATLIDDERDHYSPDQHAADVGVQQTSIDAIVWFNELS